jgi:hypothetical protein
VEVALKAYAGVADAAVVKWRSRQGDDHLVAYLVGEGRLAREKAGAPVPGVRAGGAIEPVRR